MFEFLVGNPLAALFVIMAVGLAVGKLRIFGISLGAAAAMFVALGLSAVNPDIALPPLVYQFGAAIFIYIIGLNFGRSFFREFRSRGGKLCLFMIVMLVAIGCLATLFITLFSLDPGIAVGTLAGAISSTPGMAAAVDALGGNSAPVVGYSLAYPGCIIGTIIIAAIGAKVLKVDHQADAAAEGMLTATLEWRGVRVLRDFDGQLGQLADITGQQIIATRHIKDSGRQDLAWPQSPVRAGMELVIDGTTDALDAAIEILGEEIPVTLHEEDGLAYRRMSVSNPQVAGRRLSDLNTADKGFLIARVRVGDQDVVPTKDTVLNYSDRVRVVASPLRLDEVRGYLGDSETKLGNVDLLPFSLGLLAGVLFGAIPIPLPGGLTMSFGFGGGPIVAGLVFGALGRTGPINWQLPFHAKQTISTLGLTLFLSGVGTVAGGTFRDALRDPASLLYVGVGMMLTVACAVGIVTVCMLLFKLKWDESIGVAAGMTTNPAVMAYLGPQTGTQLAERGYVTVYPVTILGKIVLVQVCALLLV